MMGVLFAGYKIFATITGSNSTVGKWLCEIFSLDPHGCK